ncbi:unnamed protein product [Gadus morhua 'NCC']
MSNQGVRRTGPVKLRLTVGSIGVLHGDRVEPWSIVRRGASSDGPCSVSYGLMAPGQAATSLASNDWKVEQWRSRTSEQEVYEAGGRSADPSCLNTVLLGHGQALTRLSECQRRSSQEVSGKWEGGGQPFFTTL